MLKNLKRLYLDIGIHTAPPGTLCHFIHRNITAVYSKTIARRPGHAPVLMANKDNPRSAPVGELLRVIDPGKRIPFVHDKDQFGSEPEKLYDARLAEGFWDRFVRPGAVVDVGYKGAGSDPIFRDAIGLDVDTPGYDGRNMPFPENSIGTIHASHLLEHIADYGYFLRECMRVLASDGTLILFVPLKDTYERLLVPPSKWNGDHKRFYTSARLLYEIETSLSRQAYRIIHLRERFRFSDFSLPLDTHAEGPYEIECVLEKIEPGRVY